MFTLLTLAALLSADADNLSAKFVGSGATEKVGGYRPNRAERNGKADDVKAAPEGLLAPKYEPIKVGASKWLFVLDEPEDKPATLFVDTNGDGDLTNDPATTWKSRKNGTTTMYEGRVQVDLGGGQLGTLGV